MPSSSSKMRNAFCSVSCAVLCFTLPAVSKAQLSEAQTQAAIEAALTSVFGNIELGQYGSAWFNTYPTDDQESGLYEYLSFGSIPIAQMVYDIWSISSYSYSTNNPLFQEYMKHLGLLNPGYNNREAIQVEDKDLGITALRTLDAANAIYQALMMSTSPNGGLKLDLDDLGTNGVEVSDTVTHDKLDNIIGLVDEILSKKPYDIELWVSLVEGNTEINQNLENIASLLETSHGDLSNIENYLGQLVIHKDSLEAADLNADPTFESAYASSEGDRENQEETAASDYESIPMSDVSDDGYVPDISQLPEEPADSTDLGLGNQSVQDHNALIRLYTPPNRPSEPDDPPPIPAVEIDWGRDQVLNQEVDKFSTFFAWFYPILGTGFLSAKALMMFRKVKLATTARALNPRGMPDPFVSLAWDPF